MYNSPYLNAYSPQANIDRINNQITELENMKKQINQQPMQPTNLTQNFQLAPTNQSSMRFANSIEDVKKSVILGETPFFSNDMSVLWVKNNKGEIKSYELNEIIPKDEKDMQIELLMSQIQELKGMIQNERFNANVVESEIPTNTTTNDESVGSTTKTSKSTSLSRVSTSKKK